MNNIPNFREWVISLNGCQQALDWLGDKDFTEFWATCDRPDWLLWVLHHKQSEQGWPDRAGVARITREALAQAPARKDELIKHVDWYENQMDLKHLPLTFSEACYAAGYFGDLSGVANAIRLDLPSQK